MLEKMYRVPLLLLWPLARPFLILSWGPFGIRDLFVACDQNKLRMLRGIISIRDEKMRWKLPLTCLERRWKSLHTDYSGCDSANGSYSYGWCSYWWWCRHNGRWVAVQGKIDFIEGIEPTTIYALSIYLSLTFWSLSQTTDNLLCWLSNVLS